VNNHRVGITLQALMSSTRLPGKPMRKLCDREMIAHQLDRLKLATIPEGIVLCTSTNPEDEILLETAEREGVHAFAGPRDDVLLRLTQAADKFDFDYIIAPAGDNPLTDPEHIDVLAQTMIEKEYDYADGVNVLPIGLFAKAVKTSALHKACEIKAEVDTEAWMQYFIGTKGIFTTGKHDILPWVFDKEFRLTVDTLDDFKLMEVIFNELYVPGQVFSNQTVLEYLDKNPDIAHINSEILQLGKSNFPFSVKSEYSDSLK
jgi:spore coat polysaccharide biosynthesis protein SpsF